jgi:predicted lipid-binding transport protein (Tim44 family)
MASKRFNPFTDISKPLFFLVFNGVFILVLMANLLHGLPGWDEILGAFLAALFLGFIAFLLGKSMSVAPPKRKATPPQQALAMAARVSPALQQALAEETPRFEASPESAPEFSPEPSPESSIDLAAKPSSSSDSSENEEPTLVASTPEEPASL